MADIVGSTYSFSAFTTGGTQILATNGIYTDPGNPGFCLGPPTTCASGSGVSGSFGFSDVTSTLSTITFTFFGSTRPTDGSFSIDLGGFVIPDGDVITGVTYASGNLIAGDRV